MVGPILDDHAADGSPYARRCLILGLILAWLISPACVTFRCEVLSEGKTVAHRRYYASLNTPFGARYFPTKREALYMLVALACLNAPSGAWCFPTRQLERPLRLAENCLNAPSGAWCFPTSNPDLKLINLDGLNAPSGAWCFPTQKKGRGNA